MNCPKCKGNDYQESSHGTHMCYDCGYDKRIKWLEGRHFRRIDPNRNDGDKYQKIGNTIHLGPDGLRKTIPDGRKSDGATVALDLDPEAFFLHDEFCIDPKWDCGKPITNWQASREYRKILIRNGHSKSRAWVRHYATFLCGGGRIKKKVGWLFPWRSNKNHPSK